jgi:hypothetical protein
LLVWDRQRKGGCGWGGYLLALLAGGGLVWAGHLLDWL